MMDHLFFWPFG